MSQSTIIGLDLVKRGLQLHGDGARGDMLYVFRSG